MSLSDEGSMLETLEFVIHIGSTRTFIIIRFKTAATTNTSCNCILGAVYMGRASPVIRVIEMIRVTKIFLGLKKEIAINYRMLFTSKLYQYFIANLFEPSLKVRYTQLELINSSNFINLH